MNVELALERTRLWKEKHDYLPEYMTEFYLMEHQLVNLKTAKLKDKIIGYYKYKFVPMFKKK